MRLLPGPIFACACFAASAASTPDPKAMTAIIVEATNDFRAAEGRGHLGVNARLANAAQRFAEHMARTDHFDHRADGRTPGERAREAGYGWCFIAENIAYEFRSSGFRTRELAEQLVEDWKNSAGHRHNMLDRNALEMGAAVARSEKTGRWYGVQMFGHRCR